MFECCISEPVPPSVLSRCTAPLWPLVSAFSGKQQRGSSFDRLVPDLPPVDFIKHALSVAVHPMARPCPLPSRLVNTIVTAAKLAENLVAHRWKLFQTVLEKHHELSAARNTWRASLSGDSLTLFGSWDFPLFLRLLDEAGYEDKHLLHDISSLPLIGLSLVSGVLSPKSMHATVFLSEFWSKVPLNAMLKVFNRVGPTGDTELDRRASDKTHVEFALGLMDGPYNSLEECPGQHKVLVPGNLADKVELAILTIAPKTGSTKYLSPKRHTNLLVSTTHVSAIKQWEASLPGVKRHGFVADLWKHFRQIGIGLNLVVVFWCHNSTGCFLISPCVFEEVGAKRFHN